MQVNSIPMHDVMTLKDYFSVKKGRLFHRKSGIPYPLLSYCIHKLLPADKIGFNDPPTKQLMDSLQTVEKETCLFVPTGSQVEGLQANFFTNPQDISMSDCDMFIIPKFGTIPEVDIYEMGIITDTNHVQMDRTSDNFSIAYPGYVIMTPKNKFQPFTKLLEDMADFDEYTKETLDLGSGKRLINKGPSLKAEITYVDCLNNTFVGDSDFVYAFPSKLWPKQAHRWLTRHRPAGWPSVELTNHIKSLGTHYVKKPPKDIPDSVKEYYWRISFSFAERELAKNFNDTQRQCAILLKLLKQKEVFPSEILTSYHMKTIMYWACEEIPSKVWVPSRLGQCFMEVLDRLYLAVVRRKLPHYFIPDLNLFTGIPKQHMATIARRLDTLRRSPMDFFNLLSGSFFLRYVSFKYRGINEASESDFVNEMGKDFSKTYPELLILGAGILRIANNRFQKDDNLEIFKEAVFHLYRTVDLIGTISTHNVEPYKQQYLKTVEMAALIAVDQSNSWPCCELVSSYCQDSIKSPCIDKAFVKSEQDKIMQVDHSKSLYNSLQEKYKDDIMLTTFKMMFSLLAMLLNI